MEAENEYLRQELGRVKESLILLMKQLDQTTESQRKQAAVLTHLSTMLTRLLRAHGADPAVTQAWSAAVLGARQDEAMRLLALIAEALAPMPTAGSA